MGKVIRYTFSGHESFFCKSMWLKKGYDAINSGVDFNSSNSVAEMGVGRNMVSSIRYWVKSFGLLSDTELTPLASRIFNNVNGWDPFVEDTGTLWLLHYNLVVTGFASIYPLFFLEFKREKKEFDKEQLLSFIKRKCVAAGQSYVFNENTVKKDIRVLLQNYIAPSDTKSVEDFSALLIDLNLVKRICENRYIFSEIPLSAINIEILYYAIASCRGKDKTVSFDKMQELALIFGLSIGDFIEAVHTIVNAHSHELTYTDNSGVKNIQFFVDVNPMSVLQNYYKK